MLVRAFGRSIAVCLLVAAMLTACGRGDRAEGPPPPPAPAPAPVRPSAPPALPTLQEAIGIDTPPAGGPTIHVTVDAHGGITVDGQPVVGDAALRERIHRAVAAAPGAAAVIAADGRARYSQVIAVMDVLKSENVSRLALQEEPAASAPARP